MAQARRCYRRLRRGYCGDRPWVCAAAVTFCAKAQSEVAGIGSPRAFKFTHEAVREWKARFAPLVADKLRVKRKGKAGHSWHVDETYIRVGGAWK
jgi:transposase-like protein